MVQEPVNVFVVYAFAVMPSAFTLALFVVTVPMSVATLAIAAITSPDETEKDEMFIVESW